MSGTNFFLLKVMVEQNTLLEIICKCSSSFKYTAIFQNTVTEFHISSVLIQLEEIGKISKVIQG